MSPPHLRRRLVVGVSITTISFALLVGCTSSPNTSTESSTTQTSENTSVAPNSESPGPGPSVPVSVSAGYDEAQTSSTATYSSEFPTAPTTSNPTLATTEVPAPGGGNVDQTVPEIPVTTLPAVPVSETADLGQDVAVTITDVKSVTGVARGPGEVGGPAAALTVKVENEGQDPISLSNFGIAANDNAGTPAISLSGEPASPMSGSVGPGQSASGVYVFALPANHLNPLQISISYGAGSPTALFIADVT